MRRTLLAAAVLFTACGASQGQGMSMSAAYPMTASSEPRAGATPGADRLATDTGASTDGEVVCRDEAATGSNIVRDVCRPRDPDAEDQLRQNLRNGMTIDPAVHFRLGSHDPFQHSNGR